jgi:two-component sensor histidine kinase
MACGPHYRAGRLVRRRLLLSRHGRRSRGGNTRQLLVRELNHRVKNTLASVQAIAQQTMRVSRGNLHAGSPAASNPWLAFMRF